MANSEVSVLGLISAAKINEITKGDTAPAGMTKGDLWSDTSTTWPQLIYAQSPSTLFQIPHIRVNTNSGTQSITGSNISVTGFTAWSLSALSGDNGAYIMTLEGEIVAGGASFKDLTMEFYRTSGTGVMTLLSAFAVTHSGGSGSAWFTPVLSGGTSLLFSGAGAFGAGGVTNYARMGAVFTLDGDCSWDLRASRSGAEANDPTINRWNSVLIRGAWAD